MHNELISILITTYNRCHCLNELLNRLTCMFAAELEQETVEILVFNDASTDETEQVCTGYETQIHYLSSPHNVGYIEGRRRLIAAARGAYLVSLDDDSCFVDDDALTQIRAAFAAYPTCGVLAANIADPNRPGGQVSVEMSPLTVAHFIGCGHVLRAELVQRVGGYPDFLAGYGAEEIILTLRVLDEGYQVIFLPSLRVYHAVDGLAQRPLIQYRADTLLNQVGVVVYAYPLWLLAPGVLQKVAGHIVFFARHKSLKAIWLAAVRLPRMLRSVLKHRRPVQTRTIKHYYSLRRTFTRQSKVWQAGNQGYDIWPETQKMFVNNL